MSRDHVNLLQKERFTPKVDKLGLHMLQRRHPEHGLQQIHPIKGILWRPGLDSHPALAFLQSYNFYTTLSVIPIAFLGSCCRLNQTY